MLNVPPRGIAAALLVATSAACASPAPDARSSAAWVGTITTEGNVTTVVNESGSVWGGTATLVEEASIGVEAGADPYMFGRVGSVWAVADEIYVVDQAIPTVRVYDREGAWLRNIGRQGQGPGEYERPYRVATDNDGTVFVSDIGAQGIKIDLYTRLGEYVDTWRWPSRIRRAGQRLVVTREGIPHIEVLEVDGGRPLEENSRYGMQAAGPDGKSGELRAFPMADVESRARLPYLGGRVSQAVPFTPRFATAMLPGGGLVYGDLEQYRLTIEAADGARTVVERRAARVALLAEERDAYEQFTTAQIRSREPAWTWNGPPIPDNKPAFEVFYPAQDGRLLVRRKGTGVHIESLDCIDAPTPDDFAEAEREDRSLSVCWRDPLIWDVFGSDGRYLGELDMPDLPIVANPFLDRDGLIVAIEDEAGTIMVKRYRLVLPGEQP